MGVYCEFARVWENEGGEQGEGFDLVRVIHRQVVGHLARRLFGEANGEQQRIVRRDWRHVAKKDRDLAGV